MPNSLDRVSRVRALQAAQQRMEAARRRSYDSMRRVLAIRRYGGAVTMTDPHEVITIQIDEAGSPVRIHIRPGWEHDYTAPELAQAVGGVARLVEIERSRRAQEHLERHPEALEEIGDDDVEREFLAAAAPGPPLGDSLESVILTANDSVPQARAQAERSIAAGLDELRRRRPVRVVLLAGVLVAVVLDPEYVAEVSTTRLNADLAAALAEALDTEPVSPTDRTHAQAMRDASTQAHVAATAIITALRAMQQRTKESSE